ncbi:MAG TPA: TIGR03435 family protein [Acidobacteriaceae bacterium]|jgi:uncharacterized protein (TIGR03435 family)|nr:TIGR03435 family protein [Acidobacteriaceae bacterium]
MQKLFLFGACFFILALPAFTQTIPPANATPPQGLQEESPKPHTYEVVSIKPSDPNSHGSGIRSMPDGFAYNNIPIVTLLKGAYELHIDSQVVGLPNWAKEDGYDITAKTDPDTAEKLKNLSRKEREQEERLMDQSILADRCQLKVHEETRELPVYELVIAKGGLRMKDASPDEPLSETMRSGQMSAHAMSVDAIVGGFAGTDGRLIVDKTGLEARKFDFELKWAEEDRHGTPSDDPSFFTALEEQLGLKLVPAKAPVKTITIDHIDRPSPN